MSKLISKQNGWGQVAQELKCEELKLASYDETLLKILGDVSGKKLLDYGCGPGVLASALLNRDADIHAHDISDEMRQLCGERIGHSRIYPAVGAIETDSYDGIICNLVMCIVDEWEVKTITDNIASALKEGTGRAYIGFCNPKIYDIAESKLDLRPQISRNERKKTSQTYHDNHSYMKTKKEGGYQIVENHRPIEWYIRLFERSGLNVIQKHFTPRYGLNGYVLEDFVIFEVVR